MRGRGQWCIHCCTGAVLSIGTPTFTAAARCSVLWSRFVYGDTALGGGKSVAAGSSLSHIGFVPGVRRRHVANSACWLLDG
jgi:hypothetical protein